MSAKLSKSAMICSVKGSKVKYLKQNDCKGSFLCYIQMVNLLLRQFNE